MANQPIPSLPVAITLDGTEQMELVQPPGAGGTTKRATTQQIANLAGRVLPTITVSTAPPSGGKDGDLWFQVAF